MRILMLSPVSPWPPDMGGKRRILSTLEALAAEHEVTFVARTDGTPLPAGLPRVVTVPVRGVRSRASAALRALLTGRPFRVEKFGGRRLRRRVRGLLRDRPFDLAWACTPDMLSALERSSGLPAVVLDLPNVEAGAWGDVLRHGSPPARLFAARNLRALDRFEARAFPLADLAFCVSDEEGRELRRGRTAPRRVEVLPNGVDVARFRPAAGRAREERDVVLFCGALDVTMNVEAVRGFARDVLPPLRRAVPGVELRIVGRRPGRRVRSLARLPGVSVLADVPDVRPCYDEAKLAVAPFLLGGGTKTKVLEAMAMGVPVVSTPAGCRGLGARGGSEICVVEDRRAMAERIAALLPDRAARETLAARGRRFVEERFDRDRIFAGLGDRLVSLVRDREARP